MVQEAYRTEAMKLEECIGGVSYGNYDPYLKGNKAGNRPHYYCFEDTSTGIYWMIPLSSRIGKYKQIMEKRERAGKPCDILHIVKLDDSRESAFLIQDMFPIKSKNSALSLAFSDRDDYNNTINGLFSLTMQKEALFESPKDCQTEMPDGEQNEIAA